MQAHFRWSGHFRVNFVNGLFRDNFSNFCRFIFDRQIAKYKLAQFFETWCSILRSGLWQLKCDKFISAPDSAGELTTLLGREPHSLDVYGASSLPPPCNTLPLLRLVKPPAWCEDTLEVVESVRTNRSVTKWSRGAGADDAGFCQCLVSVSASHSCSLQAGITPSLPFSSLQASTSTSSTRGSFCPCFSLFI